MQIAAGGNVDGDFLVSLMSGGSGGILGFACPVSLFRNVTNVKQGLHNLTLSLAVLGYQAI